MLMRDTLVGLLRYAARAVRRVRGGARGPICAVTGTVSSLGCIVLGGALGSVVVAVTLGWAEFLSLGATLTAGVAVAALFLIGRARFRVAIELTPRRVVAGERAYGRLFVTNTGVRRSTATRLELPVGEGVAEFRIPSLGIGSSGAAADHSELFAVPTARRAVIVAGPAVSVRGDQLGLLRRRVRWGDAVELFVHPVTVRLTSSNSGLVRDLEGSVTSTITDNDLAFHALRPYQPGDDQRFVHWRTTARTGQLMVRQFHETRRSELLVTQLVDAKGYGSESADPASEFELAVSIMASLAVQVVRERTGLRVLTETRRLRTDTVTTLLDDSCRLDMDAAVRQTPREFIREAMGRGVAPSVLVVVTGSATPIGELRAIEAVVGPDTRLIGLRAAPGCPTRTQAMSRFSLLTIGELDDLPKLLKNFS